MLRIVRAGRGFGVILDRNDGQRFVTHAFNALVVEVYVRNFNFGRERVSFYRKAVIVRSDFHVAVAKVLHGLIAAAMAEHQLESVSAKGAAEQLMAKTNSKSRRARCSDLLDLFDLSGH